MSRERLGPSAQERRAGQPAGVCTWCGKEVGKRLKWCSQACIDEQTVRRSPSQARKLVYRRDKGVCALCSRDTDADTGRLKAVITAYREERYAGKHPAIEPIEEAWLSATGARPKLDALSALWQPIRSLWEADHIVPVVEGGGACGLDNYRTLCLRCHRAETAALAKRRAEARRTPTEPSPQLALWSQP